MPGLAAMTSASRRGDHLLAPCHSHSFPLPPHPPSVSRVLPTHKIPSYKFSVAMNAQNKQDLVVTQLDKRFNHFRNASGNLDGARLFVVVSAGRQIEH
ncbi:unnamed protein product [Protopolystoma xenopodis]|uniref:Uncharacterized protein n=1 Tax=Protopolystoma xenopodis TaxID=117903 RepID=A0A3S5CQ14_9PLAT|nr:unnamed protein product [Protopolystoma xenopodis]